MIIKILINDKTPLSVAVKEDNLEAAEALLKYNANPLFHKNISEILFDVIAFSRMRTDINAGDQEEFMPLHHAIDTSFFWNTILKNLDENENVEMVKLSCFS